jgi:hypothetical protein
MKAGTSLVHGKPEAAANLLPLAGFCLRLVSEQIFRLFAGALQRDYAQDGQTDRVPVANVKHASFHRNPAAFESKDFRRLTRLFATPAHFDIKFASEEFIDLALERIRAGFEMPLPRIELRKGSFGFVRVELRLLEKVHSGARFAVKVVDTVDQALIQEVTVDLLPEESIGMKTGGKYPFLDGLVLQQVERDGDDAEAHFADGTSISVGGVQSIDETSITEGTLREIEAKREHRPLPNNSLQFVKGDGGPAAGGAGAWSAPGGFGSEADAPVGPTTTVFNEPVEDAFPDPARAAYSELVPTGDRCLYDAFQTDSAVEKRFVLDRLEDQDLPVAIYFRFPGSFKIRLPKVIGGNYNPDWGICVDASSGRMWIVRETKGNEDILKLRFSSEARKIVCGYKYFQSLGIDYRAIRDDTLDWLLPAAKEYRIGS